MQLSRTRSLAKGVTFFVIIQSGEVVLELINVHFEPHLILRNLRERLRRIAFHWPRCPECFGMSVRKGGSASGAKPSQKMMQGKRLFSAPFSNTLFKLRSQNLEGKIPPPMVRYAGPMLLVFVPHDPEAEEYDASMVDDEELDDRGASSLGSPPHEPHDEAPSPAAPPLMAGAASSRPRLAALRLVYGTLPSRDINSALSSSPKT